MPDYPLPPTANNTEILRVVVRESMSADLLERLIADIVAVTDSLVDSDPVDLSRLQTHPHQTRIERRQHQSEAHGKHAHRQPRTRMDKMGEGVHKTVC